MKYKIGDKVIFFGCPFDEQIPEEMKRFVKLFNKIQTVTKTKDITEPGTSGQWIKTSHVNEWIDKAWFCKATNTDT